MIIVTIVSRFMFHHFIGADKQSERLIFALY